jgi:signal transduction histidine kinase
VQRVDYLEEVNRQFLYAIDVVKAFGELQRKIGAEHDVAVIQRESARLFSDLINFDACAFFMLQADMLEFAVEYVDPESFKDDLQEEINLQIEAGTFSWVLNQPNANIIPSMGLKPQRQLLFHPLSTENRVLGMFVVVLNDKKSNFSSEILTLLSIVLISTSLAIENAILYQDLSQHNVNLNQLVAERTLEIRKLLGMAAHDLRNPLAAIRGFAEILNHDSTGELNEDQKELMDTIYETSHSLLGMVNDLLDISVIDSGEMNLSMASGNLVVLISEIIRLDQITADRKAISINFEHFDVPEILTFDTRKMRQVIDNLISNAIKFSPHNSAIMVTAKGNDGKIEFQVKDEGPGIPENEREELFKTFGKTSVQPTGGETSTGLGLAICHRIVIAHGGNILVQCPPEGGSEFIVSLNAVKLDEIVGECNEPGSACTL